MKNELYLTGESGAAPADIDGGFKGAGRIGGKFELDRLRRGRPEFCEILGRYRGSSERHVAVLFCGPPGMEAALRRACASCSGPKLSFEMHSESFML